MRTVEELLAALRHTDPTKPRLTWYGGPGGQDRIELSGRVLDNWVSKSANLLQDDLDVEPGCLVHIDLPTGHWRWWYWSLAVLTLGATLVLDDPGDRPPAVTVTSNPDPPGPRAPHVVLVTLAALARGFPATLPSGAIDEAGVLLSYPDEVAAWQQPGPDDIAVLASGPAGALVRYGQLLPPAQDRPSPVRVPLTSPGPSWTTLQAGLTAWAGNGSVVVTPQGPADLVTHLLRVEGVTGADPLL